MPWAKKNQFFKILNKIKFEAFIAEPWLVEIYFNIYYFNYFIHNKKNWKRNWGECWHFFPKFSTNFFFEVMIAKLWLVGIYLDIFPVISLSLIIIIIVEKRNWRECWHFFPKVLILKYVFEALIAEPIGLTFQKIRIDTLGLVWKIHVCQKQSQQVNKKPRLNF
jgi:hypothetical protein